MTLACTACLLLFCPPQDPAAQERRVERLIKQLERKLLDLSHTLEERDPGAAQRLKDALHMLTTEQHVLARVRETIAKILEKQNHRALHDSIEIEEILKDVLALLEARVTRKEVDRLERALKTVRSLIRRQRRARDETRARRKEPGKLAEDQGRIEDRTRELRKSIPGEFRTQETLQRAADNMESARHRIKQARPEEAATHQTNAIDALKRAETEIQKRLGEQRRVAEEEMLIALEAKLQELIEEQTRINAETSRLDSAVRASGRMTYAQLSDARALCRRETVIRETLDRIHAQLAEENSAVFAFAVSMIRDDLQVVTAQLTDGEVGRWTQRRQDDILRQMRDLARAFREEAQSRVRPSIPSPSDPSRPPLVPDIVQLRLIRTMQKEVLRRTHLMRDRLDERERITATDALLIRHLTEHESRVRGLMRIFSEKVTKLDRP